MFTTIRDQQKQLLTQTLSKPNFSLVIAHIRSVGPIGCCAPEGKWYITQEDLDEILIADGRGLIGKVEETHLELHLN